MSLKDWKKMKGKDVLGRENIIFLNIKDKHTIIIQGITSYKTNKYVQYEVYFDDRENYRSETFKDKSDALAFVKRYVKVN